MPTAFTPAAGRLLIRRGDGAILAASQALRQWTDLPADTRLPVEASASGLLQELAQTLSLQTAAPDGTRRLLHWRGLTLMWRPLALTDMQGQALVMFELQPTSASAPVSTAPPSPLPAARSTGLASTLPGAGSPVGSLAALAAALPGALYQYQLRPDGTGWFPYADAAIEELLGVTPAQVASDSNQALRHVHADDVGRFLRGTAVSYQTLLPWRLAFRVNHPRRGLRWVRGVAQPERLADGSMLWHGHMWDITDEKATPPSAD